MTRQEAQRLAQLFQEGEDQTGSRRVQDMLAAEKQRLHRAFAKLPVEVVWVDHDPYAGYAEMRDQVLSTGKLMIWTGASDVPMWDPYTNWVARAVHDWDHIVNRFDFSQDGEYEGFRSAARQAPQLAPLYLSEIAMQASVFNTTGAFAEKQKIVLLDEAPERWATSLKGLGRASSASDELVEYVPTVAALLAALGPEKTARVLGAEQRWTPEEGLQLIEAAHTYNALVAGQMDM